MPDDQEEDRLSRPRMFFRQEAGADGTLNYVPIVAPGTPLDAFRNTAPIEMPLANPMNVPPLEYVRDWALRTMESRRSLELQRALDARQQAVDEAQTRRERMLNMAQELERRLFNVGPQRVIRTTEEEMASYPKPEQDVRTKNTPDLEL